MTSAAKPTPKSPEDKDADGAEKTRKLIRDFVETPPAKTMADVKAASDVYEANTKDKGFDSGEKEKKPLP